MDNLAHLRLVEEYSDPNNEHLSQLRLLLQL